MCNYRAGILLLAVVLGSLKNTTAQSCSDVAATAATKMLYKKLHALQQQQIIFGHQDALAYGVGRKNAAGNSDIKIVAGDNPGMYGWDIGHLELDSTKNLDGVSFTKMKQYIQQGYKRGAVITISWHLRNPLTGGSAWDTTHGTVTSILPGGSKHELYKTWLDRVAVFMNSLKNEKGEMIPVLFRPFHELTGNWFWWCKNTNSTEEFKQLWIFTVDYLRQQKNIHHLLYVYNTANFSSEAEFLERYPGDAYVDVLSFDQYQHEAKEQKAVFIQSMRTKLSMLSAIATTKNKLGALAETGFESVPDDAWWTGTLWPVLKDFSLSYVLVWRNHGYMPSTNKMHYYAPYKGQQSAEDFRKFYRNPKILFEKKLKTKQLYN
ncbi:MAG: beta-mannosidase [Chitinophagaceae bacterium]|nr:beta-mannosidase [Chitinophagaceae bacterium]